MKLNLIALTDLVSGALAMHGIRITAKFDGVTYQMEPGEAQWRDPLSGT